LFASESHRGFSRKIAIQQQPGRQCNRCSDDHFQLNDLKFRELQVCYRKRGEKNCMTKTIKRFGWLTALLAISTLILLTAGAAQDRDERDRQDDPPSRVARIGYMEGSVSFQPAGEPDWVQAVPNRPMTTGDKLWTDKDSRAELQLGSAVIRLNSNTGFSFLNLDDDTVQIQLTSGSVNLRVRRLDRDDVVEIDTPNLAFSVTQPGSYRVEASEDGTYSVVSIREGGGESTGNGQTYTLHAGQRGTFSGTDSLNAEVIDIGGRDQFDNWAYSRDHRYDESRSARYLSHDVVGYEDLDDYGDWRDDSNYGHIWFPNRVAVGWAPYHDGHWEWISPWGYTWVDDSPWGYAPFHYGRWVTVRGRWGWVAGPVAVRAVYAPALVVFIGGGGVGVGFGGNVGWFPLGPREVYVPSYHVSREYVNRVNISNTTVNNVQITNVYNTTIINNTTNITNVRYANRNVRGAVMAVPQRAFASAQPVRRESVSMDARQIARAPVSARVVVAPTRESIVGAKFATANRVTAPPPAVMNRQVIAKRTPPPPPVPFASQQQALASHPGQPLARSEMRRLRPAVSEAAHPMVKQAPPGKPATAKVGRPGNQPGNRPNGIGARPDYERSIPVGSGQPVSTPTSQPSNRPANLAPNQPAANERPGAANPAQPSRPPFTQPNQPNARPEQPAFTSPSNQPANRPANHPANQPAPNERPGTANPAQPNRPPSTPANQPESLRPNNRPEANHPTQPPIRNDRSPSDHRPPTAPPDNRPDMNQPNNRPGTNLPPAATPNQPVPSNRPETSHPPTAPTNNRPNQPSNLSDAARPQTNRTAEPATRSDRPSAPPPNKRLETDRPAPSQPEPNRNQPAPQPQTLPPTERQQQRTPPPVATKPAAPPQRQQPKAQTPAEKKQEEERRKKEQQKPPDSR
jgi:hypothetical protein